MAKKAKSVFRPDPVEVAALAYEIYEKEGRPHGRELDHWFQAELMLRNNAGSKDGSSPEKTTDGSGL